MCWQLPLRLVEHVDENGHVTSTLREWKRRDWGDGGAEFHWWCTESPDAFVGRDPVYEYLRDEIIEMVGAKPYELLLTAAGAPPSQAHAAAPPRGPQALTEGLR